MQSLLVVAICLALGLGLRRVRAFAAPAAATLLNAFVIYVPLPALILVQVPRLKPGADMLAPVLVPWVLLALSAGLVLLAAWRFRWSRARAGALLLVVPLGNTSFLGIPLTAAFLGDEAVPYAVLYDQLGSFLALTVYGAFIVAAYSASARAPRVGAIARSIVVFPPFIALLLAVLLILVVPGGLPSPLIGALEAIAASLVPTVMVAVGLQWRLALARGNGPATALALGIKLILMPLVAYSIVRVLGLGGIAADTAIFEAAMGPMITASALAIAAGLEPELVAGIVGYGTVLSLGTSAAAWATLLPS